MVLNFSCRCLVVLLTLDAARRVRSWCDCPHSPEADLQLSYVLLRCCITGTSLTLTADITLDHSEVVRPRIAHLLGKGLGWVEGEAEHKRMRQLVSPALS